MHMLEKIADGLLSLVAPRTSADASHVCFTQTRSCPGGFQFRRCCYDHDPSRPPGCRSWSACLN